jgi:hypothetical protein
MKIENRYWLPLTIPFAIVLFVKFFWWFATGLPIDTEALGGFVLLIYFIFLPMIYGSLFIFEHTLGSFYLGKKPNNEG